MSQWNGDKEPLIQQPPPQQPPPYAQAPPPVNPYVDQPPYRGGAYPPAQNPQAMPQHQHQQNTTVVVSAPTAQYHYTPTLRDQPVRVRCPNCQNEVMTQLDFTVGTLTWVAVFVFFLLGLFFLVFWICIFIPFLVNDMKDVNHNCPVCKHHIGCYKRM